MARPTRSRKICSLPKHTAFGAKDNATDDVVTLTLDEDEAIRFIDFFKRTHEQCAVHMGISRTTVTEIYERARFKIADMLVNGKELIIDGGSVSLCGSSTCPVAKKENVCEKK